MDSEIASIQPNPYLFNIENRKKRKARLAHEIGAGARCLKCEDKCPGFELHFWRKVCQNCRCGKDDHDVQEEDEDIGKIVIGKLFERPIRTREDEQQYSYGTDLEIVNESTGRKEKLKFDWIPPGVASNIAKRYMEMLPPEKRPVAGTEAAKERKRQLEHQLPLYDMDESERCENLPPDEHHNFQKYLEVLRSSVAGQASVQEIGPALSSVIPAKFISDLNVATSTNWTYPNKSYYDAGIHSYQPNINQCASVDNQNVYSENSLNNNAPNSNEKHVSFDESLKTVHNIPKITDGIEGMYLGHQNTDADGKTVPRHLETSFPYQPPSCPSLCQPLDSRLTAPKGYPGKTLQMNEVSFPGSKDAHTTMENTQIPINNFKLPQNVNKTHYDSGIKNLAGPRPYIAKSTEQNLLPGQYSAYLTGNKVSAKQEEKGLSSIPYSKQTLTGPQELFSQSETIGYQKSYDDEFKLQQNQYYDKAGIPLIQQQDNNNQNYPPYNQLPQMLARDGQVLSSYAVQAPYAAQRDTVRGPGNYAEGEDVHVLFPNESQILGGETKTTKESSSVDMTLFFCQYCKECMNPGDVAVICERAGPDKYWHPQCFVCVTCKELLADLIYFYKDGQIFCGRHYTQAADIPRCKACDELIFSETWTRADGFDWHIQHYCCFMCDNPLAGKKYVPDEKCFPHCMSCYMAFKAKMCETCEDKISPSETRAGFRGYFYHAKPECFCCYSCHQPMIGKKFKMVKNWVFCSQDCINTAEQEIMDNPNPKEKED